MHQPPLHQELRGHEESGFSQTEPPCELLLPSASFAIGDTLTFDVHCTKESLLEVSVFSGSRVLLYTNDQLREGHYTYRALTADVEPGQYFVLVKGAGIHEQRTVVVE